MQKYLVFLFIGISLNVMGQQLSGSITDSQNKPLSDVDVYIEELQIGTSTNEEGYYQLNNLPNRQIKLTVTYLGYDTQHKIVTLEKEKTILNITLSESVFKMDEVIISTPFNKLQSQNVMKVDKVGMQQLKNKGATTLVQGITSLPGVSQVSTGVAIGKPVIRGLRGNRVLVYSQGLRLENQQFGAEHGLGVDESSVESVEVIKGPASLLYGSDAMGGVLFFNPLKFAKVNSFKLNLNQKYFSNTNGTSTSFGVRKSFKAWKFLANGTYRAQSDYKIPDGLRLTNSRFNETIFNAATNFNNKFISSTLRVNFSHTLVGIPEEIGLQTTSKTHTYPYQDLTNKMLSLNNIIFLPNSKITTTFGYTINDRKEIEEEVVADGLPAIHLELDTYSYDVKWHLPALKHFESIVGIQGMIQKNQTLGEEILIPNAQTNDFGVFLTGNYKIKANSFQGGVRFDNRNLTTQESIDDEQNVFNAIDKSFKNVTASFGYKTTLFGALTSRINFAAGFRAPNLAELTSNGVHEGTNRYEIGNSDLQSEHNFQSDVALEYKSSHVEVFANGFYNNIDKYIYIEPTGAMIDDNFVYNYVQNNAALYGGEFGFHIHPHPLDWLHLNSSYEMVIGEQSNGEYLPLIPANKLTNTLRAELSRKSWLQNGFAAITLENHFKQNKVGDFETPTSQYNLINLGVGGSIKLKKIDFNINLNVNNVADTSYISHLSRLKADGIPNIGRNVILGLTIDL